MSSSNVTFKRWEHVQFHSWPFNVYKQYNEELSTHLWTDEILSQYLEKEIKKNASKDDFKMAFSNEKYVYSKDNFITNNKERRNWNRLNVLMSASSNFETFLESIISLAIESDPGVLLGCTKSIDGTFLLKKAPLQKEKYKDVLKNCVEGEWSKRVNSFKNLFGGYPDELASNVGELDKIRILRNKVGHAFGRDIEDSRNFSNIEKLPSERISLHRLLKCLKLFFDVAKSIDLYLLSNHIGEYQAILAYHNNHREWMSYEEGERIKAFKKMYGAMDQTIGKKFSKGLVQYYTAI